jgi:hypothetical protein
LKLAKTLTIIACASLLSAGVIGFARHAYAQDAQEDDSEAGAWSADIQNPPESNSEPKAINVHGCWSGTVDDGGEGEGTATFKFDRNGSALGPPSSFKFFWNAQNFVHGPISGSLSSTGIKFKGTATKNCSIKGSGTLNGDDIDGTYTFQKACAADFLGGSFTLMKGCP